MSPEIASALFWACVVACAAGQGALLWSAVRRLDRRNASYEDDRRTGERRVRERWSPDRRSVHDMSEGSTDARWRELTWALLPAVGLALLLAATWGALP